jgi:hypothetical protein
MFRYETILLQKYKDVNKFYLLRMDEKFETQQSNIKCFISQHKQTGVLNLS